MSLAVRTELCAQSPPPSVFPRSRPFLPQSRWLESYVDVNFEEWAEHSVAKPWQLAKQYPYEVTVLNKRAMFWP